MSAKAIHLCPVCCKEILPADESCGFGGESGRDSVHRHCYLMTPDAQMTLFEAVEK